MENRIPKYIVRILSRLEKAGYTAFIVGGCVRDLLLGRRPNDFDVTTSARPEEVMRIFPRNIPVGLAHGTVLVRTRGGSAEVTTFRSDGEYVGGRRPLYVTFQSDIQADLSRRDFTVNAMSMDSRGALVDLFGGRADLDARMLHAVGDPVVRFTEDALRMLRAFRFSARLGFSISTETLDAIIKCATLCSRLSAERVRCELDKTLLCLDPAPVGDMLRFGLLNKYLCRKSPDIHGISRLRRVRVKRGARWAALCYLLRREGAIDSAAAFLLSLRHDNAFISAVSRAVELMESGFPEDREARKQALRSLGERAVTISASAADGLFGGSRLAGINELIASGECYTLSALALTGQDLLDAGIAPGPEIGIALEALLDHVIKKPGDNDRDILLRLAHEYARNAKLTV